MQTEGMDVHTEMLYNNIFKVVHYAYHNPGTWNFWLCQRNRDGGYFVYALPIGYVMKDARARAVKYLTGFCFGEGSYEYAGSVMMDVVKKANDYFGAGDLTIEWVDDEDSYDRHPVEIREEESRVNSPDR